MNQTTQTIQEIEDNTVDMEEKDCSKINETNFNLLTEDEIKQLDITCKMMCDCIVDGSIAGNENKIIQIFSYISNKLFNERYKYIQLQTEYEKQKGDLEHFSLAEDPSSKKYKNLLKDIGDLIYKRRDAKDASAYLNVASENIGKVCGFITGMENRQYTPRSKKYGNEQTLANTKTQTKIKLDTINNKIF